MRRLFLILHRTVLAAGVLVALTPCAICQVGSAGPMAQIEGCPMNHSGGKEDCCHHGKTQNSYCKAMNQSAVQAAHAPSVAVSPSSFSVLTMVSIEFQIASAFVPALDISPPRTMVLRI